MQYCAVYINQGLNAHREAFSPAIIIEELLLQRFLHTLYLRSIIFTFSAPKQDIYNRNQPPGPLSPAFNCRIKKNTLEGPLAKKNGRNTVLFHVLAC